ncbi:efflux RND transporter periplasmic adaptor subunit [Cellvibrio fibrivorans]|uniref:Peptide zinc metalloprotease protein n=1 Tax=Cellvibrio fibrivorans TaxID=126350 RepID=A0ABU1V0P0_9GAMM|nr:HlyD family efflux transporter periplasmic adaptor subunit [Cellvibrio fibrivorans]MDR7090952.1 putative peptide zinc metalloprotease protein [Cellvibrio fibrivorans]
MTESQASNSNPVWQRLESLRPSLPRHIHIQRRDYNGERWYILQDKSNGRFHRLTPSAWRLISAMDGRNSLSQVLASAAHAEFYAAEDEIPTRDDLIHLLQYLHVADLLVCDLPPNTQELFARREQKKQQRWLRLLMNPLTWNIPLGNPDRLLDKLMPVARLLASRPMGIVWLLVVGYALLQVGVHWTQLTQGHLDRVLSPSNLFLLWLTYPCFKVLHELGHGLFTKVWGGQVNDCGLVFVVGTPLPYVDASAATGFQSKRQRLMVGAAGMAVELFLAALALLLWLQLPNGFLRDFLYNIIILGGVSTLFFNGNPLMRFDGYHLLTDAFDLPNLATRANQQFSYLLRRYAYGLSGVFSPAVNYREAVLLTGYSVAAFAYRLFMLFFIILLVANYFPTLGLVIGCWLLFFQLLWPALKALNYLMSDKQIASKRARALGVTGAGVALAILLLVAVPMPMSTSVEAVLWLPDEARVKVESSGEVAQLLVVDGTTVEQGQELVRLHNPVLMANLAVQQAHLREYEARYQQAWVEDRAQAQLFEQDINAIKAEIELLQSRVVNLVVRSPSSGIFRITRQYHLPGSFLRQGDEFALIEKPDSVRVRAALLQDEIGLVRQATAGVSIKFASNPLQSIKAEMAQDIPVATRELPSQVLGAQGGGRLAVDSTHPSGTRVKEEVFLLDLALNDFVQSGRYGERAYVRFQHPAEPLAAQWYRALQQLFIRHFS